uniref:C1q domain-containing protein n=1 Tax=Hippocampus comes TaxID=109280 RepID=A0A3Q2X8I4_HIPCM
MYSRYFCSHGILTCSFCSQETLTVSSLSFCSRVTRFAFKILTFSCHTHFVHVCVSCSHVTCSVRAAAEVKRERHADIIRSWSCALGWSPVAMMSLTMSFLGETKVAFAAALTDSGSVGPFDRETTLIFSKVFTNVGRAYDENSGVFTAPVGGVYVFSFTAADFLKGYMGVTLYRNQQPIVSSLDLNDHGGYASATNGALIPLEAGDRVRLSLPASYRLYDDTRSFSVFSGFLLFPLKADQ